MATPAHVIAAVQADLGRSRQEELPLSNEDKRGRSYIPPPVDESKNYDPQIKQLLKSKWSTAIADEESEQMVGLTNLNARPWASSGYQAPSLFVIPKSTPPAAPRPAVSQLAASQLAASQLVAPPAATPPNPTPTTPSKPAQNHVLDAGKCHVSMYEGSVLVPDANFCVAVSVHNDAAFFMLTAPGKPPVCLNVLDIEAPIIYGTACIIKTRHTNGKTLEYTIKPLAPSTAENLARVLENIQIALRKALKLSPPPKPPSAPSTPFVKTVPAKASAAAFGSAPPTRSLICDDSPESSPEPSPHFTKNQLVEVTAKKPGGNPTVKLDDVINNISVTVRTAYCQLTGCSMPILPTDSDADETKRGLLEILRFLGALQLKKSAARAPLMCSQTMDALKTIDRGIKNNGGSASYSASEMMGLRKDAVVPTAINVPQEIKVPTGAKMTAETKVKKGLSSSLWA
ncbi:hypothetical protein LMH87_000170 [Akanthomyces muscarius]|uniref:Uncharacterized protein n=1 Tax=Akanthomyces muscarius TaxID=2231603 RepID=A0A9W8UMB9_AKAMU|nr:hypothetical protein LMH87_000170 [Akanthomyces muscarius]KAJ4154897.1 hypothetical protein LMH87_000170 [Akanthomyces muscarius]